MKKMKRIFSILLVIAMIATLAACGGKKPATGNNGGNESLVDVSNVEVGDDNVNYVEQTTEEQRSIFGDLKGTVLKVGGISEKATWEKNTISQMEQLYGIKIEYDDADGTEIMTKVTLAIASGDKRNYYDVAIISNNTLMKGVYGNLFLPMDQYIDRNDPAWRYSPETDFLACDLYKMDGQVYGAPSEGFHENFIFYNKTYIVDECGVNDPYEYYYLNDNWTFDTLRDVCEAITTDKMTAIATWNYFTFVSAAGNKFVQQDDNGKWDIVIDEPSGMEALGFLHEAASKGWMRSHQAEQQSFLNRETAMIVDKPIQALYASDAYNKMTDEIGMVPMPKLNSSTEKYTCPMLASGFAIAACAQNPAGAAAYIYHFRAGEQQYYAESEKGKNQTLKTLSEKHQAIRKEYLKVCEFDMPYADGLVDWWDGTRTEIINTLMNDLTAPAAAVDSFIPKIKDCLRNTGAPC